MLVQIDLAQNRHGVALLEMRDNFAFETGLAADVDIFDVNCRRAGNQRHSRLGNAACLARRRVALFVLDGLRFFRPWRGGLAPARARASAAGEVIGAGIGGSVFVLSCAMALVATIVPKISQQFVFMIPKVKFLFPSLSMSAICPVSTRPV